MKKLVGIILGLVLGYNLLLWFLEFIKPNYWMGVYYPYEEEWIYSEKFKTKQECILWAQNIAEANPIDKLLVEKGYLWECNRNCELDESYEYLLRNSPNSLKNVQPLFVCDDNVGFDDMDYEYYYKK